MEYQDVKAAEKALSLINKLAAPTLVLRFAWCMVGKQKGADKRTLNASREIERVVRQWVAENTETGGTDDLDSLREDAAKLSALEAAGVDNWSGYDYAMEILHERERDHG